MKICRKGYGLNERLVLRFKKPEMKIRMKTKTYFNLTSFLRFFFDFLNKNKFVLLSVLCMALIFLFSSQTAEQSSYLSSTLNSRLSVVPILGSFFKIVSIRKCAHFALYFCLSILVSLALCDYDQEHIYLKSILICFVYACSDELHQLFVDGRSCMVMDVCIDTIGATISLMLIYIGCMIRYNIFDKNRKMVYEK